MTNFPGFYSRVTDTSNFSINNYTEFSVKGFERMNRKLNNSGIKI